MRYFLSLKAYGDLVIACHALRKGGGQSDILICTEHLKPLLNALSYSGKVSWLAGTGHGVPAVFDIRKHGVISAIRNAVALRSGISAVTTSDDTLVFDRIGWRQRYLAAGRRSISIVFGRKNIYLDYEAFLGFEATEPIQRTMAAKSICIFPDSRIRKKQIPEFLVRRIYDVLNQIGCQVEVVRTGPGNEVNTFEGLKDRISVCGAIVSADSLPAHLAEYLGIPIFVFSPVSNVYWLPRSAYVQGYHALFSDSLAALHRWAVHLSS